MRHELSAVLVVRNGESKIEECLRRLVGLADEFVIVDTGSTDKTLEMARKFQTMVRQPVIIDAVGTLFLDDEGNFDFGKAKNYGFSLATKEYVMWVDVNDMLDNARDVRAKFDKASAIYSTSDIVMYTRITRSLKFPRVRIVRRETSRFINPIHEYVIDTAEPRKVITFKNEFLNFKKQRDVARNLKALIKLWKNGHSLRTAYYIATSYKDTKNPEMARLWYEICLNEFPYWEFDETIAAADYVVADALKKGEFAFADELTMEMIENIPQRAESFYYRYVYNVKVNKLEHALKCLVKLRELPPPPRSRIGVNMKAYNAKEREERIEEIWRQVKYNHQTMNTDARVYDSVQQAIDATQFMQTLY